MSSDRRIVWCAQVPVFWEQRGKTVNPKPRISRVLELTTPALRWHLETLTALYGPPLVLSLLEQRGDESDLSTFLSQCVAALLKQSSVAANVRLATFDFHAAAKQIGRADACRALLRMLASDHRDAHPVTHGYFAKRGEATTPVSMQRGVVRRFSIRLAPAQLGTPRLAACRSLVLWHAERHLYHTGR